jgi:hypothetical protein
MSVQCVEHLMEDEKITKLLNRVQNFIEVTNQKFLLGDGPNLSAMTSLYKNFASLN